MLKRLLAISIGATLLGTQALYAGAQDTFPPSTDDRALPAATEKYFADRLTWNADSTGASGTVFPPSTDDPRDSTPPALETLFERTTARQLR